MHPLLKTHWTLSWEATAQPAPPGLFLEICRAYEEPQRHYHTLRHLEHCLQEFASVRSLAAHPSAIGLALFFHDAVYDPTQMTPHANEIASANWAKRALADAGVGAEFSDRVEMLIMATCHDALPSDPDAVLLVDVDLAILGQPQTRFDAYEAEVRREFSWVPEQAFRQGRRRILEQFLARDAIFGTAHFHAAYEAQARRNLMRSVQALTD